MSDKNTIITQQQLPFLVYPTPDSGFRKGRLGEARYLQNNFIKII
jgi:hypothetical protein